MGTILDTNLLSTPELQIRCPLCGCSLDSFEDLEKHLEDYHFTTLSDYYERPNRTTKDNGYCWKCNTFRPPLTLLDSDICDYHLPCWDCIGKKKYEKTQAIQTIQDAIHDFYSIISGDRYFQMFIIDDIYIRTTLSHEFNEFKKVLKLLYPKDRNKLWLIDYVPGYPHTICKDNLEGLKIVDLSNLFTALSDKKTIKLKDYEISYPEIVPYDTRHHSRYNILNPTDNRKTKKLRIPTSSGESKCIKFFNNTGDPCEACSLFQIKKAGIPINPSGLGKADYIILKLVLLRNKTFMKLIISVLEEACKSSSIYRDSIFLKNTVNVNPWSKINTNITWLPEKRENFVNISIL